MKILLITPPFAGPRSPYPATAYLKGYLKTQGLESTQVDLGTRFANRIYSRRGLMEIIEELKGKKALLRKNEAIRYFVENESRFLESIEMASEFLREESPGLALRISQLKLLPEIPAYLENRWLYEKRVAAGSLRQLIGDANYKKLLKDKKRNRAVSPETLLKTLSPGERARYLATRFLLDISRMIREGIDPRFDFMRFAPELAECEPTFAPLQKALSGKPTLMDRMLDSVTEEILGEQEPDLIGLSAPYSDCVYSAFRIAQVSRKLRPSTRIVLGGGFANTALRELSEPKVFDYLDFITLDDGEKPLQCLVEHLQGKRPKEKLLRTFLRDQGKVLFISDPSEHDVPQKNSGAPDYEGLPQKDYMATLESLSSLSRHSSYRWYDVTLAHGCYWKKCTFCDIHLDRIERYDPAPADVTVDKILAVKKQTGHGSFGFTDEAMPPSLLRRLSERLIERRIAISWWGMARFDKAFTPDLARLMAKAGCTAIFGGLEIANDRVLKIVDKGVTVEQAAKVMRAFSETGIRVHAFLQYGYPSQTEQETIDALEVVRQLFQAECIASARWSRFVVTPHSPIGRDPKRFGIVLDRMPKATFARYRIGHKDLKGFDPTPLEAGLIHALDSFQQGIGLDQDIRSWFKPRKVPHTKVPSSYIEDLLS